MKPLTRPQIETLAASVSALLDQVRSGELTASTAMQLRLEGARAALDAVLGRSPDLLTGLADHAGEF